MGFGFLWFTQWVFTIYIMVMNSEINTNKENADIIYKNLM